MSSISRHIKKLLKTRWSYCKPIEINNGNCDWFALDIADKFPEGESVWGDDIEEMFNSNDEAWGHCFFVYKGKYYDSECPKGVDHPTKLPFYIRIRKELKKVA